MLKLLYRLYERDASSGDQRTPLLVALAIVIASISTLAVLVSLPFREVHTTQGTIEPGRRELMYSEGEGAIRRNELRLGRTYEPNEPVLVVASGEAERAYIAPCRCVIARSDLLQRSAGTVRAGELVAEFIDAGSLGVRFALEGQLRSTVAPGGKVYTLDEQGRAHEGQVEQVYPRQQGGALGLEAFASVPSGASLELGSRVTVRVVAPPVSLWRLLRESLGRRS